MGKSAQPRDSELAALNVCVKSLSCLDEDGQIRVTEYLSQRFMQMPEDDILGNLLEAAARDPQTDDGGRFKVKLFPVKSVNDIA